MTASITRAISGSLYSSLARVDQGCGTGSNCVSGRIMVTLERVAVPPALAEAQRV